MSRRLLLAAVLAAPLCAPAPAGAYESRNTHRWLTREAAKLLVEAYPGRYDELLLHLDTVAEGTQHEDDLILDGDDDLFTLRVMRHFFRPTDFAGLTMPDQGTFPSSYEWGVLPNDGNAWGWDDGMAAYRRGDTREAYFVLGHVVHLIQDLTVPAHSHLDIHGPPAGDDYENYCTDHTIDEFSANLPVPPPGTQVPEFASPWQAWHATGRASYWRNMYEGDLSDTDAAGGDIALMFPGLSWSWFSEEWSIGTPPVGALGADFIEAEPGYYYFKTTEFPAAFDRMAFDRDDPTSTTGFGENAPGDPMTALIARDMIPMAIVHSAAIMKLYLDQAYAAGVDPEPEPPVTDPEPEPVMEDGGCSVGGRGAAAPFWMLCAALALMIARRRN